jgi:FkbM family methyltransferase
MRKVIKLILHILSPALLRRLQIWKLKTALPKVFIQHVGKLNSRSTVIDIGANEGFVSECLAQTGAKVLAFEPNSKALGKLKEVAKKFPNIKVHGVAAGIKNSKRKLYMHLDKDMTQASSLKSNKPNVSKDDFEHIDEIDFAEFMAGVDGFVDLIKIDIEGYEIELLNHLLDKDALQRVGKIYLETHERKFTDLKDDTEKLKRRIDDAGLSGKFFYDWH